MLFKFAFDMIKNNKIMSTAIVLQLAISIMLLNVTLAMYNDVALRLNVLSDFDRSKTLFYMSKTILSEENEYENLKKLTDGAVVEPVYTCGFVNKDLHPHFYCEECQQTYCLDGVEMPQIQLPAGFEQHSSNFMIKGTCPHCRK